MIEQNQINLATAMADEAAETSPPFSPELHSRIMQRISVAADGVTAEKPSAFRPSGLQFLAAAAAVLVIAGSIVLVKIPGAKPVKTVAHVPTIPAFRNPVATISGSVDNSLVDARFAYLDRDARSAYLYLAHQVNVLPVSR
jgi:hypothetical protein